MLLSKKIIYLLPWLFFFCMKGLSAEEYGIFDHYTTNDGLISNRVFSLATDKDGGIWASTNFGLEKFDGTKFTHHRKTEYPELSREDYLFIHTLPNGIITAGGYNGLLIEYNPVKDTFFNVMPKEFDESFYKETMGIYHSTKGEQYLVTNGGAYTYDKNKREYSSNNTLFRVTQNIYVRSLYVDAKGRYWIGSIDSLLVKDAEGAHILKYIPKGEACSFVRTILPIGNHKLAVASQNNEIWIFDDNSDSISAPAIIKTPFSCITNIIRDKKGRYWIATDGNGLWYTDQNLSESTTFTKLTPHNASIDEVNKIYSIMEDNHGDIWFSTQNSGIWRYRQNSTSGISTSTDVGFPPAVCTAFVEDENHNIIVSVDGGGLYTIDPKKKFKKLIDLPNNNISNISKSKDGTCYVATWGGGVYRYYPKTNKIEKENFLGINNPCNCFFGVNVLNGTDIYACTTGDGLYRKKAGDDKWSRLVPYDSVAMAPNKWILFSFSDTKDNAWINSSNTLWLLKGNDLRMITPNSDCEKQLTPLQIFDLKGEGDGYIFAASNKGIKRISPEGVIEDLPFIPEYFFRIILKDDNGNYWVAGDNGIYSFNYKAKTCTKLPGNFSDVATNYFYFRAGYKAADGKLYFGTNIGYICVNPKELSFETKIEHLSLSSLSIGNKKVSISENPLNGTPLSQRKDIKLAYGQTDIAINIQLVDFADIDKAICQYRLVGLQDQWLDVSPDRIIRFSYIPTGDFQLEVKAFRSNEECEQKVITLSISVLPPWWQSWWFMTLCVILIGATAFLIYKHRVRHLIAMKNKLNEEVAIRTMELQTALKDKDSLISVIGHDLRNPMFAIVVALENWLRKEYTMNDESKHHLIEETLESAKTLQGEMLKLLNWAKSKQDDIVCKPQEIDIESIINDALLLSDGLLKSKNINTQKKISLAHKAYADDRMVSTVVRNIIGNAIKYTNEGGTITAEAWEDEHEVHIAIRDTGVGMNSEVLNKILSNEQEEMSSKLGTNQEKGTGLGLNICKKYIQRNNGSLNAESKLGEGTTITINLPISVAITNYQTAEKGSEISLGNRISKEVIAGNVILIVDDNPLICENMKTLLSDICEVRIAHNGQEALDIVAENEIDLILSDVDMPVMNGIELCGILQQDEASAHIPLLFVSGRIEENDRLQGLSKGAIDYITKPFNQEELLVKLCSLFKHRELTRSHILESIMRNKNSNDEGEPEEASDPTTDNPFLNQFMDLIRERHSDPELSVDDLADEMCVSRSTMFRRIKTIVGKSPVELLGEYRLNEALRQLKSNESVSVNEVAYAVGFSDASYFSKKFKAYFGINPTQARS